MDSRMERWGVGVCWEEEGFEPLAQDFLDGGLVGFIPDMKDLLEMPREVAVELWTQADEGFVGNNDRLDKKAAAMALTMVVYIGRTGSIMRTKTCGGTQGRNGMSFRRRSILRP